MSTIELVATPGCATTGSGQVFIAGTDDTVNVMDGQF